jgi:hypothetical protein
MADEIVVQIDIEGSGHDFLFSGRWRRQGQRDPEGLQDPEDVPSSQVSLPFSSSMTNRSPVPEVKARAFCVTPRRLRVPRITLAICSVCISSPSPKMLPYGKHLGRFKASIE